MDRWICDRKGPYKDIMKADIHYHPPVDIDLIVRPYFYNMISSSIPIDKRNFITARIGTLLSIIRPEHLKLIYDDRGRLSLDFVKEGGTI